MAEAEQPERLRPDHAVTVDDVRQLMGSSTPHFALQLRNRIRKLIAPLAADDPARIGGGARDRAPGAAGLHRRGPRHARAGRRAAACRASTRASRPRHVPGVIRPRLTRRRNVPYRLGRGCAIRGDSRRPDGIPGSALTGPWPVGQYADALRQQLRGVHARVQVFGEVFGFKAGRAKVWFELRDANGALPCSMWRKDFDALGIGRAGRRATPAGRRRRLLEGFYPGSRTASPSFSFAVSELRVAGEEGDLLALARAAASGACTPRACSNRRRRSLSRCCRAAAASSPASPARRATTCWPACAGAAGAGRLVWAFAPVQGPARRARGPARAAGPRGLRGGRGRDRRPRRRSARRPVRVLRRDAQLPHRRPAARPRDRRRSAHHTDRTLLDDVAAVACSTPTHAAEAAVKDRLRRPRAARWR